MRSPRSTRTCEKWTALRSGTRPPPRSSPRPQRSSRSRPTLFSEPLLDSPSSATAPHRRSKPSHQRSSTRARTALGAVGHVQAGRGELISERSLPRAKETDVHIADLDVGGQSVAVWLRTHHDGIEFVGHLWFGGGDPGSTRGVIDRAILPGANLDENVQRARRLTADELRLRYERAT